VNKHKKLLFIDTVDNEIRKNNTKIDFFFYTRLLFKNLMYFYLFVIIGKTRITAETDK
jgi:hypothetical protein